MSKQQGVFLIVSISVLVTGMLLSFLYRPYVYANNINDFGFADVIGSLVSVIGFCFFVWSFKDYSDAEKNKQIILATILYGIIWESIALIGIHGTFDWRDTVAAFISGVITYLIKEWLK